MSLFGLPLGNARLRGPNVASFASGFKPGQTFQARVTGVFPGNRAELLVAGQRLTVETDQPLQPGQTLSLDVVETKDGIAFKLSTLSSGATGQPSFPGRGSDSTSLSRTVDSARLSEKLETFFPSGQTVQAKVAEVLTGGTASVSIAGQTVTVETEVPLSAGQTVTLEIVGTDRGISFKVVAPESDGRFSGLTPGSETVPSFPNPSGASVVPIEQIVAQVPKGLQAELSPGQLVAAQVTGRGEGNIFELLVGGQKIQAESFPVLTPGQMVSLEVAESPGGLVFKLAPASSARTEPDAAGIFFRPRAVSDLPGQSTAVPQAAHYPESDLKNGQILPARVIQMLPENRAEVMVAGQKVFLENAPALSRDQVLFVEVTGRGENLTFRPAPLQTAPSPELWSGASVQTTPPPSGESRPATLGPMLPLFQLFSEGSSALAQLGRTEIPVLQEALSHIALKSGEADDNFLPKLIRESGLMFEKKIMALLSGRTGAQENSSPGAGTGEDVTHKVQKNVKGILATGAIEHPTRSGSEESVSRLVQRDLKGLLLSLSGRDADGSKSGSLKGAADALEGFQRVNIHTATSHRFLLPFPVQTPAGFEFGQLLIDTGGDKKGRPGEEERTIQVAFLMHLTALGRIRADFSILKKSVTGRFLLEDQDTCDYIAGLMPELQERLRSINFHASHLSCQVAPAKALAPDALMLSTVETDEDTGLNLVI